MFTVLPKESSHQRRRAPNQLPPGRHKLGRGYVEANQRQRILDGLVDVASQKGYATISVDDIIGAAGVSRRTFYEAFRGKEEAFLASLDVIVGRVQERLRGGYASSTTFPEAVRNLLAALLAFAAEQPRHAEALLIESLAAGPAASERRNRTLKTFADLLGDGVRRQIGDTRSMPLTTETIAGGVYEVISSRLIAGEAKLLPTLLSDLSYSVMLPFLGHDAAADAAARMPGTATVLVADT